MSIWIYSTLQQDNQCQGPPIIIANSKVTIRSHITLKGYFKYTVPFFQQALGREKKMPANMVHFILEVYKKIKYKAVHRKMPVCKLIPVCSNNCPHGSTHWDLSISNCCIHSGIYVPATVPIRIFTEHHYQLSDGMIHVD
jgi:hypothetical protein